MPTRMATSPVANKMLPHQSIRACFRTPMSFSMKYAHTVPNAPIGAETRNTRCQLIGPSTPPSQQPEERARDGGDRVDAQRGAER